MPAIVFLAPRGIPVSSRTLNFVASATSSATSITLPAGIQAGDIIVLWDKAASLTATPTTIIPTGFTSVGNIFNSVASSLGYFTRSIMSYKIANGSEGGSSIAGMSADSFVHKIAMVFRPNFTPSAATPKSVGGEVTVNNPASQTVSASFGTVPLIIFGFYGQTNNAISPRTFSPSEDGEISNSAVPGSTCFAKYKIYNGAAAPANHSVDMDDEGDLNILQSFYLEVA
jgi:hypothetical protein